MFWSDSDEDHARASLRQCIRELNGLTDSDGQPLIVADRFGLRVRRDLLQTDLQIIAADIQSGQLGDLPRWFDGPEPVLMADLDGCDPLFDNWVAIHRSNWSEASVKGMLEVLSRGTASLEDQGIAARSILQLDPFCDRAVEVQLLSVFQSRGLQAAIAYFKTYRQRLIDEYDIEPSDELVELFDKLRNGELKFPASRSSAGPEAAGPAGQREVAASTRPLEAPTIMVVEVTGLPARAYSKHVVSAYATELTATLGRFREWSVHRGEAARSEIEQGLDGLLRGFAEQGVEFVFLVDAPKEERPSHFDIVCCDCFERKPVFRKALRAKPNDWAASFNSMSAKLASHLHIAVSSARLHRVQKLSTEQQRAYDFWLDGLRLAMVWQPETEEAAIRCYERAIELAPQLACAHSSLAAVLNSRWIVLPGWPNDATDRERAFTLAEHAVRLDNMDHRNQMNLAWSHLLAKRWECAELHFGLAHDLNPSNAATLISHALASSFMGAHKQSLRLCERAFELAAVREPHFYGYLATIAFLAGDAGGCLEAIENVPAIFPDIQGWAAASHGLLGNDAAARRSMDAFLKDTRSRWAGPTPVTDATLVAWFKGVFPIRRDQDRERLAQGIDRAFAYSTGTMVPVLPSTAKAVRLTAGMRSFVGQQLTPDLSA